MDDRALISYQIWGTEGHPHSLVKADNLQTWLSIHKNTMDEHDISCDPRFQDGELEGNE